MFRLRYREDKQPLPLVFSLNRQLLTSRGTFY